MKSKSLICLLLFSLITIGLGGASVWQIKGQVKDKRGTAIPGACIKIKGSSQVMVTDENGKYSLNNDMEQVRLVVTAPGFKIQTKLVKRNPEGPVNVDFLLFAKELHYDMVVTSEKREANIQDIPVSLSVISSARIESSEVKTVTDIHHTIPNFSSFDFGSGFSYNSVRGVSNTLTSSNALGVYVDDVPVMTSQSYNSTDLIELERVEVLRGPQGTLYGNNTPGGVINIITKQPENFWRNTLTAGIGNHGSKDVGLSVNGPVVRDKLFLSLNFKHKRLDKGYYNSKNDDVKYGEYDNTYFRGTVIYKASDVFDLKFSAVNNTNHGFSHIWVPKDNDLFDIPSKDPGKNSVKQNTQSLRMSYSTELFDVVSITSRGNTDFNSYSSLDFTNRGLFEQPVVDNITFITQELRFVSKKDEDSDFNWIGGLFYNNMDNDNRMGSKTDMAIIMPTLPVGAMVSDIKYSADIDSKTIAAFGQVNLSLGSRFSFTVGLRYEHNKRSIDADYYNSLSMMTMKPVTHSFKGSKTWNSWTPKFSVDYKVSGDLMLYGSVAKGYKAGGFVGYGVSTLEAATFDPEEAMNYEVGFKSTLFDKKLMVNGTFFYSKVDDMQVIVYNSQTMAQEPSNVGKAEIKGLELEFSARLMENLEFSGALGILDAELRSNPRISPMGKVIDYKGNKAPLSPDYNLNLYLQYRPFSGIYARVEGVWTGKVYFDEENQHKQDAYFIGNLRIGYETSLFEVFFFGNNIFDKSYINYSSNFGMISEGAIVMPGTPRAVGIGTVLKW